MIDVPTLQETEARNASVRPHRMNGTSAESMDRQDLRLAQNGDVHAFERLYRRHLPRVERTARWLLGTDDVEDVIQEIFVRVWRGLASFEERSAVATWLTRVATNVLLRDRQRRGRRAGREVPIRPGDDRFGRDRPDLRLDLEPAVSGLPTRARTVFVLHDIHGFTHEEIADVMDTTIATSRSQLHRARQLLRKQLAGGAV